MRTTTRDPISGWDVADPEHAPWTIEGSGPNALKIYFETEANRETYLKIEPRTPESCSLNLYRTVEDDDQILWD